MILSLARSRRKAFMVSLLAAGCTAVPKDMSDSTLTAQGAGIDTTLARPLAANPGRARRVSRAADSVARRLVFVPAGQQWFTAAARGGRLLVDLGRIDLDVANPPSRRAAFLEAARARSPVPPGSTLRLRGSWGEDDARVDGFDVRNGRIVATLRAPRRVDSVALSDSVIVSAQLVEQPAGSTSTSCVRAPSDTLTARLRHLGDSLLRSLRGATGMAAVSGRLSHVTGCFGEGVAVIVVTLQSNDYAQVREDAFLVDSAGALRPLVVRDLRFRAHQLLHALDADGDGIDDVAAIARTARAGASVVLRLVDGASLERLSAGFAWER